jgi:hypothetical protein
MSSGPSEPIQTSGKGERQDVGETGERINGENLVKRRRREDELEISEVSRTVTHTSA